MKKSILLSVAMLLNFQAHAGDEKCLFTEDDLKNAIQAPQPPMGKRFGTWFTRYVANQPNGLNDEQIADLIDNYFEGKYVNEGYPIDTKGFLTTYWSLYKTFIVKKNSDQAEGNPDFFVKNREIFFYMTYDMLEQCPDNIKTLMKQFDKSN